MKEPAVADSACLIALEQINQLALLPAMFDPVLIPPTVEREFGVALPWLKVEAPTNAAVVASLKLLVDDGEAEAIALANERGCKVILDDRRARQVAASLGVAVTGTIGILVQGKRSGVIAAVKPVLDDLEATGFFVSKALREEALRLAGE